MNPGKIDLDKVKMGMVVGFESDGSFFSRRIEAYQKYIGFEEYVAKITHVAVSMGGPYIIEATFPKSRVANIFTDYEGRTLRYYFLRDEEFRREKRKNFTVWVATRCNLDYGWPALLGFYIHSILPLWKTNPLGLHRAPFCSYLVGWGKRKIGYDLWPGISSDLLTPAHICGCKDFEEMDVTRDSI